MVRVPFLPWRSFRSWGCQACGECCVKFNVCLSWPEAVFLTREYGSNVITRRNGRIILKRVGRRCIFQDGKLCSIQEHKPLACKVWPFKIIEQPLRLEDRELAEYRLWGRRFYVYLNTFCRGINKGAPIELTILEAIALHLNLTRKQTLTTSQKPQELAQWNIRKPETPPLILRKLPEWFPKPSPGPTQPIPLRSQHSRFGPHQKPVSKALMTVAKVSATYRPSFATLVDAINGDS
ncbi:MAG: YkgJ family cysteine cluster protein [Candidatus Freyarchaeota archaeon]